MVQTASQAFDDAMASGTVVWARPRVWADWANDGYGASGSIDDLSRQAGGDAIVVSHFLDEGQPSDVAVVAQDEVAILTAGMGGGRGALGASQYFSRLRSDSPIISYERDVAPVKVELGAVTASGQEYVTVFNGQMTDTPVKGRTATVEAISARRLQLAASIDPPPIAGKLEGLSGSWPVSWAMAECGVYVSPPPRTGCRWWAPLHGSLRPFLPTTEPLSQSTNSISRLTITGYYDGTLRQILTDYATADRAPYWTDGPYLEAPNMRATAQNIVYAAHNAAPMTSAGGLFDSTGAVGRIEFMVRGDAININSTVGGSAFWTANIPDSLFNQVKLSDALLFYGAATRSLTVGIRRSDRKPIITITDGGGTYSLVGATALPTDGNWYGIGAAWNYSLGKLWIYYNGTVASSSGYSLSTANLPNADPLLHMVTVMPAAEVHVTGGTQANPDTYPWVFDAAYGFTPDAVIGRSRLTLEALADTEPSEAWDFIASFAQSELASLRTNESDQVEYLPLAWWVEHDKVDDVVDTLSTDTVDGDPGSVGDLTVTFDVNKVRNSATVSYPDTTVLNVGGTAQPVFALSELVTLPPGITTIEVTLDSPAVLVRADPYTALLSSAGIDSLKANMNTAQYSWATVNTLSDGTGTYLTDAALMSFSISRTWTPGSAIVTFNNASGATYYLVNNKSFPALGILGYPVLAKQRAVTVRDENSIAVRGERNIVIDSPRVQTDENATWLASAIVGMHAYPRPRIENLTVFADPRRQPGDLVRIVDEENTGLDDQFRLVGVKHTVDLGGAMYTQTITARQQDPSGLWDQSTWDNCVWGE